MNDEDFRGSPNVVLYVFDNSYGLEWAKEHNFSYEIMEEEPIEKELIDTNTGIKVDGTMDTDAALKVEKLENTYENSVATYDITLQRTVLLFSLTAQLLSKFQAMQKIVK